MDQTEITFKPNKYIIGVLSTIPIFVFYALAISVFIPLFGINLSKHNIILYTIIYLIACILIVYWIYKYIYYEIYLTEKEFSYRNRENDIKLTWDEIESIASVHLYPFSQQFRYQINAKDNSYTLPRLWNYWNFEYYIKKFGKYESTPPVKSYVYMQGPKRFTKPDKKYENITANDHFSELYFKEIKFRKIYIVLILIAVVLGIVMIYTILVG